MKKHGVFALIVVACMFFSGLFGFYLGRLTSPSPILVEKHKEPTNPTTPASATSPTESQPLMVNINTANKAELEKLPGIGPVTAQRIIDYREKNGLFGSVTELTMVEGIGLTKLEAILDYITVGGNT